VADSAFATILSESKSISTFTFEFGYLSFPVTAPLEALTRNVHLLNTNLFYYCNGINGDEQDQLQYQHEARNRRLLHNWQCICVLLASYRANVRSPIRDSILSLVMDVTSFLVPDEWYVLRSR
jgi:hypothetical protein